MLKIFENSSKIQEQYSKKKVLSIPVTVVNPFENTNINLKKITKKLSKLLKNYRHTVFSSIDAIYVGNFDILREKNVKALFLDNAIYLSNEIENESDAIHSIIHETAHVLEELSHNSIYQDETIEKEFLQKRKTLTDRVFPNGPITGYFEIYHEMYNLEYSLQLDTFLYDRVGEEMLHNLTKDIFLTPYSSVSLSEYFSIGFERYIMKQDLNTLFKMCPKLYKKLEHIDSQMEKYEA